MYKPLYTKYEKIRDKVGATDYEVAKQSEIAAQTLSDWKKGTSAPKIDKLMRIAKYFGVSMEALIGEAGEA